MPKFLKIDDLLKMSRKMLQKIPQWLPQIVTFDLSKNYLQIFERLIVSEINVSRILFKKVY